MKTQISLILVAFFILLAFGSVSAQQQELSSFADIHSGVESDYATYAFKFTYLGAKKKIVPTNGGHGSNRIFNVSDFKPFERSTHSHGNDDLAVGSVITLSNHEFKAFVDGIGTHPALQGTQDVTDPNASLMIIGGSGSRTKCWEHLAT